MASDCLGEKQSKSTRTVHPTETLVEQARNGDREAIADLVRRYEAVAVATALGIVGDFHHAQDIAQESFVSAIKQLETLRDPKAFGPWLLTMVRRTAGRANRQRSTHWVGDLPNEVVESRRSWQDEFLELVPLLERLPEHERQAVELRYLAGMSVADIAQETGRPVGTITKQLSRAVARLRDMCIEVE